MSERLTLSDDASVICNEVLARYFIPETRYVHQRIPNLVNTIAEQVVQRMTQEAKLPRKYIAHVVILQKNGSGLYAITSCSWNPRSDSCYVHKGENAAMYCIVTLFGVTV